MDRTRAGRLNSKTSWAIALGVAGLLAAFAIYQVTRATPARGAFFSPCTRTRPS